MKTKFIISFIALITFFPIAYRAEGQMILDNNVFLQGKYIEAGVAPNGCLLNKPDLVPAGYHVGAGTKFGVVSDPDKDGWGIGANPFLGDYVGYAYPHEVWILYADGVQATRVLYGDDASMTSGMTGNNIGYSVSGTKKTATWSGVLNNLEMTQTYTIDVNHLYILIDVKLRNKGTKTIKNIYYARECDPDVDGDLATISPAIGIITRNRIVAQTPNCTSSATAYAYGDSLKNYMFGITTTDPRAKTYFLGINGLVTTKHLDTVYSGADDYRYAEGDTLRLDTGMGIVFKLDSLKPGEETNLWVAYGTDTADLDLLRNSRKLVAGWEYAGVAYKNKDIISACEPGPIAVQIKSSSSDWNWQASPYLSTTSGLYNNITVSGTQTYMAIHKDSTCPFADTLILTVKALPVVKPVLSRTGALLSCGGTYVGYQWYHNDVAIPGETTKTYTMTKAGKCFVMGKDANGCWASSDTVDYDPTSLSTEKLASLLHVYPNPALDKVSIQAPVSISVTVYDIYGKQLQQIDDALEVNLSGYADGLYLLYFTDQQKQFIGTRKIIKRAKD